MSTANTTGPETVTRPDWVDANMYPFPSRYLDVGAGRMHYVDEGAGPVLLMVHGTPTWSFLYRHVIRELSSDHRVIAVDHLGFGLSDKPEHWSYRPEDHARKLAMLIDRLALRDITLVVHDFGGPIGLSYAIAHAHNVRAVVLFNTWLWSLRGTTAERMSKVMSGALGRFLYTRLNFSPRVLIRAAFGDKRKLRKDVHRQYIRAFSGPAERKGPWIFARELAGSNDWYENQWRRIDQIAGKPTLMLWGMKDPAFGADALDRWKTAIPDARIRQFPEAGHFVQEEAPEEATREIRAFLTELVRSSAVQGGDLRRSEASPHG